MNIRISSFAPSSGTPNSLVTLEGSGFDGSPKGNVVQFNGIAAAVLSATPTTLQVRVPPGATTGFIFVTRSGETAASPSAFIVTNP